MKKYKAGQILTINGNRYRITKCMTDPCLFCELPNMCGYYCDSGGNKNYEIIPNNCCFSLIER